MNPNKLPPHLTDVNSQLSPSTREASLQRISTAQIGQDMGEGITEVATLELLEERPLVEVVR